MSAKDGAADKSKKEVNFYCSFNENLILTYKSVFGETKSWISNNNGSMIFHNESKDFKYVQKLRVDSTGIFVKELTKRLKSFYSSIKKTHTHTIDLY